VFTWAALQTAYPNGGGALAALPAGTTAYVTDACKSQMEMTPNAARTRWVPVNGAALLLNYGGDLGSPVHTWAGATGKAAFAGGDPAIGAGLLGVGDTLLVETMVRHRGTGGTANVVIRLGTSGAYGVGAGIISETASAIDNRQIRSAADASFADATSVLRTFTLYYGQQTAVASDAAGLTDLAALMYITANCESINAADFMDLIYLRVRWFAQ
jgi:hypothetical protein